MFFKNSIQCDEKVRGGIKRGDENSEKQQQLNCGGYQKFELPIHENIYKNYRSA